MSTAPVTPSAAVPAGTKQVVVVSHSNLFYWWPVWAIGYLMAIITFFDHGLMATVPHDTKLMSKASGTLKAEKEVAASTKLTEDHQLADQDVLIAPKGEKLPVPRLQMTPNKSLGVVYAITLLLVIVITNVPLRGLWSVIVIVVIILLSVIFAWLGVWRDLLETLGYLDIRINLAGYLVISTVLLIAWLVVFFFFDRQIYMVFTPGNVRVQLEIGDGETSYDTTGMMVQKQRNDLFRHWILGLGSGDLIVNTSGAQTHHFDLPNVLSLGRRVREIEELLRTKEIVAAPTRK